MSDFRSITKNFSIFLILLFSAGAFFKISPESYPAHQSTEDRYHDFCHAIESGNIAMAKILYEEGIDLNAIYQQWETPLMVAVAARMANGHWNPIHKTLAEWLLSHGADVNLRHPRVVLGTPLLTAIFKDNLEAVKFLIDHGADVNGVTLEGDSPFSQAASGCDCNLGNFLISKGADVTLFNKAFDTPLTRFVKCAMSRDRQDRQAQIKMVRFLLDKGADPEFRAAPYASALQEARARGDVELYEMLRAARREPTPKP